MITPIVGNQLWYWMPGSDPAKDQPEAATVAFVHHATLVNLQVISHNGVARGITGVSLRQDKAAKEFRMPPFAEWSPYPNAIEPPTLSGALFEPGPLTE